MVRFASLLGTRVWLVTGYDAARAVLADSASYANDVRDIIGRQDRAPAERIGGLGMTDQPDHGRLRGVLTPWFTRRRLADLQDDIDRVVDAALDDMAAHGPVVDLVERFGFQVPFGVMCYLLGICTHVHWEARQSCWAMVAYIFCEILSRILCTGQRRTRNAFLL